MKLGTSSSIFSVVIWIASLTTIAATPNINKDALIIPKLVILFLGVLWILPYSLTYFGRVRNSKLSKTIFLLLILMLLQLIISLINSSSPIEQQIFGRTGRGLGLITWSSIIILYLVTVITVDYKSANWLIAGLGISGFFAITYAIFQSFGLDFFPWDSKTNGVIGTLGNPNFVSSFTSIVAIPILVFAVSKIKDVKNKVLVIFSLIIFLTMAIYRAQSTQGYVTAGLAFSIFFLVYLFYKKLSMFILSFATFFVATIFTILGALNFGPLSSYLYKLSVQSRGEFWTSAVAVVNSHPFFGVGLDSFGDYYLKYRKSTIVNEYTDSAHNYYLDYAVNAGYMFMLLNICLVILTIVSFIILQGRLGKFDPVLASLFASYCVFLAQSLISPISIPLILWGFIISGALIGLASNSDNLHSPLKLTKSSNRNVFAVLALIFGSIITYPYVNADRLQLQAMNNGDGDLAIKVAKMYPESTVRYSILSRALLDSGLPIPALDIARSAIKFNPNSPALWALIVINQSAPIEERRSAYEILLKLDPLNEELINYKL